MIFQSLNGTTYTLTNILNRAVRLGFLPLSFERVAANPSNAKTWLDAFEESPEFPYPIIGTSIPLCQDCNSSFMEVVDYFSRIYEGVLSPYLVRTYRATQSVHGGVFATFIYIIFNELEGEEKIFAENKFANSIKYYLNDELREKITPKPTEMNYSSLLLKPDPVAIANQKSDPIKGETVSTVIDIVEGNNSLVNRASVDDLIKQEKINTQNSTTTYSDLIPELSLNKEAGETSSSSKKETTSSKTWWIIGGVVTAAAVGGGGYFFYQKKKKSKKTKTTKK